ncbi:MAG: hypothetical protein CMD06_04495 [Flavobacteriales bacterium]|nr:hypothetical protein [Flavobacteriales bacterium]|tara:strand:+ start:1097 stop:1453 length:357 start_codon:yes stop_codon:yes gene_type:complete
MDFKKSLLTLCILITSNTFSQNNLKFNQVINITKTEPVTAITNPNIHYSPTNDTIVPLGKAWEILSIVGTRIEAVLEGLWLKEESKLSIYGYYCVNYSWSNHYISFNNSIIEYTVTPN